MNFTHLPAPWRRRAALGAVVCLLATAPALPFGKNKISYDRFDWHVYPSPHFDIYYYPEEEEYLEQMVSYAESQYVILSEALDHEIKFRIPLIYYKTHGEFEQTNIILQTIPLGVGAFAEPMRNRIVLPIDSPPDELYKLIGHELVHIFEYSIFFQESLGRTLRGSPPLWLMEGLASHLAQDENSLDEMVIRDAVVNGLVPPVQALNVLTFLTYRFGAAIFRFIEEEYGQEGLRNFLWEYRKVLVSHNIEKAFKEAFGMDLDEFNRRFARKLRKEYLPNLLERKEPEDYGREIGLKHPKRNIQTFSPTISPSGDLAAVLTTANEELDIVVLSTKNGEQIRNLTKGMSTKFEFLISEIFDGKKDLSWSPEGDRIAFFARKENRRILFIYDALSGKEVQRFNKIGIDKMASPAFSPDGQRVAFSGNRGGRVDIFEIDLETAAVHNLTDDTFYDKNPSWSPDGETLVYNRRIGRYEKIFMVDATDPTRKTQLTFGESKDLMPSLSRDGDRVYYVSDAEADIFNVFSLDLQTGDIERYTDVIGGCFNPVEVSAEGGDRYLAFTSFFKGMFRLYRMPLKTPEEEILAAAVDDTPIDLEPFRPPLALSLDENRKERYERTQFSLDGNPGVLIGVADDGTIISNTYLPFSDMMGDKRLVFQLASVSDFTNFQVQYINLKRRFNWAVSAVDYRDFFLAGDSSLSRSDRREAYRISGVEGLLSYPFNRYYRADFTLGYFDKSNTQVVTDSIGSFAFVSFDQSYPMIGMSLSGDTVRGKYGVGPLHGNRWDLTVRHAPTASGDLGAFTNYFFDYRAYGKLTSRSLVAFRLFTGISDGEETTVDILGQSFLINSTSIFAIGGLNQIRGYSFREFFGDRAAFMNLELRFPLVDRMQFPFGSIRNMRGVLFLDVGAAWFADERFYDSNVNEPFGSYVGGFDFWDSTNSQLGDGRASYGFGVSFLSGPFDLNWVFSQKIENSLRVCQPGMNPLIAGNCQFINDPNFDDGWSSAFYIGRAF